MCAQSSFTSFSLCLCVVGFEVVGCLAIEGFIQPCWAGVSGRVAAYLFLCPVYTLHLPAKFGVCFTCSGQATWAFVLSQLFPIEVDSHKQVEFFFIPIGGSRGKADKTFADGYRKYHNSHVSAGKQVVSHTNVRR